MIRHRTVQAEPAEPPISQIEMHLFTQPPLRADAGAVADEQHPDHQFGINRGPARCAVERRQMSPQPIEVEETIDGTQHVIGGNVAVQPKLIE